MLKKMKENNKEVKKTSAEWALDTEYIILDPDGWDRSNYDYSFNKEKVSLEEFNRRLSKSTVLVVSPSSNNSNTTCICYVGTLNEPHAKCEVCGKEEWQHKFIKNYGK